MGKEENNGDLIQGTLEMLVLKALARGPLHGYAIAEWIHNGSQQVLKVEEGALYPALHRMELRGLLDAKWGASESNRRALLLAHRRRPQTPPVRIQPLGAALRCRRLRHASHLRP